ncbi:molybdenum ABC transporter ATP-binding protein [Algihabitans albus]|uniref:molybdenum ABC transporter ATP-binding protein n=1 Tax=Algihabitans albus TaxID=2164067 RepID=UPI0035D0424F
MLEISVEKRLGALSLRAELNCPTEGVVALFGRSGAGKTSLVNMLAGLLRPDRGRIALRGETLFDSAAGIDLPPHRRRIGYVFQESRLFPHLKVRDNLLYGWRRTPEAERPIGLEEVVALLGLKDLLQRRPGALSGGEKQRVALGRALLANPRLLLMDEPLANLDQARKQEILPFVERLRDELRLPIVYVSHAMEEIVRLADTLVLVSDGRVVASGPLEELTSRLDLRPLTGRYEAGAVVAATLARHDLADDLSELSFAGGLLVVPRLDVPEGTALRLRIRARDVALSLARPEGLSIQNIFPARVLDLGEEGGAQLDVRLDVGGAPLWARITARARRQLDLAPGREVYALVKSAAIDRGALGRPAAGGRFLDPPEA